MLRAGSVTGTEGGGDLRLRLEGGWEEGEDMRAVTARRGGDNLSRVGRCGKGSFGW